MSQVINVKSDATYEIIFEPDNSINASVNDPQVVPELNAKIETILNQINQLGFSEVHAEKGTWRQFVHVVSAGEVLLEDFGQYISEADFADIMFYKDKWMVISEEEPTV